MNKQKNILLFCATLLSFFLLFSPSGFCSATYVMTEQEMQTLQENLTILEQNNNALQNLLSESNLDLTTASEQSEALNNQIQMLKIQLTESKNQILVLKQQLIALKEETGKAKQSLQIANNELENVNKSFSEYSKEQKKIQNKLRQQKTTWQIIGFGALIYAVAK